MEDLYQSFYAIQKIVKELFTINPKNLTELGFGEFIVRSEKGTFNGDLYTQIRYNNEPFIEIVYYPVPSHYYYTDLDLMVFSGEQSEIIRVLHDGEKISTVQVSSTEEFESKYFQESLVQSNESLLFMMFGAPIIQVAIPERTAVKIRLDVLKNSGIVQNQDEIIELIIKSTLRNP